MFSIPDEIKQRPRLYRPFLAQLSDLFIDMDRDYADAADHFEFHCTGCEDNCCLTRFHHHTLLEYLLLAEGFAGLDHTRQAAVFAEAEKICQKTTSADARGRSIRLMCPLNQSGLCILYIQRPMICRLHGIPHELHRPGGGTVLGPGCGVFHGRCGDIPQRRLDRTPYYIKMAGMERALQQALGVSLRIKMTVAEMLVAMAGKDGDPNVLRHE